MEIEVLREDKEGFEIRLVGEDHTFPNLLNTALNRNKKVMAAAYKVDHPLVGAPTLFFRLKKVADVPEIPVGKIKGIGPKTAEQLEAVGIRTAGQLVMATEERLARTGISEKLLAKYLDEARKAVPEDRFGYRAVLKETLKEISRELEGVKKGFKGAAR